MNEHVVKDFVDMKDYQHDEEMDDPTDPKLLHVEMDLELDIDRENLAAATTPKRTMTRRVRSIYKTNFMRILQFWRWLVTNLAHGSQWLFVEIGRFTIDHFYNLEDPYGSFERNLDVPAHHDAKGPNIHFR